MKIRTYNMVQYTPEWWQTRRGVPTASQFDRILTPKTLKPSGAQKSYICDLIAETADLRPNWFTDRPMNAAQRHGLETEDEARRFYAATSGLIDKGEDVRMVGFVYHEELRVGCSPDGLVGEDGVLELKCVQLATQASYVLDPEELYMDYRCQCHGHLIVTGRRWVDLVSYAPGQKPLCIRVEPDDFTLKLQDELRAFNKKYDDALHRCGVKRCVPPEIAPGRAA